MDYDVANDFYLYFDGYTSTNVYKIQPTSGTSWAMTILSTTGDTPIVNTGTDSGTSNRFRHVENVNGSGIGGFIYLPSEGEELQFLRTI